MLPNAFHLPPNTQSVGGEQKAQFRGSPIAIGESLLPRHRIETIGSPRQARNASHCCACRRGMLHMKNGMTARDTDIKLDFLMDPWWRKARIAARLLLKREKNQPWTKRDRRLARQLAQDPGVTNRLIDQAIHQLDARQRNGHSILDIIA